MEPRLELTGTSADVGHDREEASPNARRLQARFSKRALDVLACGNFPLKIDLGRRLAHGGGDELGRGALSSVLVRRLRFGHRLFERAPGGGGLCERGAELRFAVCQPLRSSNGLRRSDLPGIVERRDRIVQLLFEGIACACRLRRRVVVPRLQVGDVRCRCRQLRRMPRVRVLSRGFRVRQIQLERAPGGGGLCERGAELRFAVCQPLRSSSGLRRSELPGIVECRDRIVQLLFEGLACARRLRRRVVVPRLQVGDVRCGCRQLRCMPRVRVLSRGFRVRQILLET